ncbi:AraC-type transcriptional regulator [Acinetobacter calcoaceticus]|uniref:AraC-type transcriptional regulator n=1 Tax=Acinetobacter calcoaceticus TaxID=471 RepID=A0A4R1Y2M0_ACICA|nr:AraC-type transcriptional regulator [Acinetobacter calcoaceticus]
MTRLLDDFCKKHQLESPFTRSYGIDERITFESWLENLRRVDSQYQQNGLGLDIGAMIDPSYIGISAYITNSVSKIGDILTQSFKYNKIWYNYMPKTVNSEDDEISVSWGKPAYLQVGLYVRETAISEELQIAIFYTRLKQISDNHQLRFNRIEMAIPCPQDEHKYLDFFDCPIIFDTEQTKIYAAKSILDIKVKDPDPVLLQLLKKQADDILLAMGVEDSFVETVNQNILVAIQHNKAHVDYVAQNMNISARVLQNNLRDRQLCFQDLLSKMRFYLSQYYLSDPQLSLLDVSFLLAYDEQSSFNRAFKKWTGISPSQWREQHEIIPIKSNKVA